MYYRITIISKCVAFMARERCNFDMSRHERAGGSALLRDLESHQLQRLETRVPILADDEVVVHGDAERARDLDDCPRHVDIGARRGGIAGGMIVQEQTARTIALIWFDFCAHSG